MCSVKLYVFCYVALLVFLREGDSARILAVMPTPSYSHQIVYNPLWRRLAELGHHITLFTTDPLQNINSSNFRQVDWSFAYQMWHNKHNISSMIINFSKDMIDAYLRFVDMMSDIEYEELKHPQVMEIINNKSEHFDLLIVEYLCPAMFVFSKRFNCPFIGVSPMHIPTHALELLGNPHSPAAFSDPTLGYPLNNMNFIDRLYSTFHYVVSKYLIDFHFIPKEEATARIFFGNIFTTLTDVVKNVSVVFLNINPVINEVRPMLPNLISIGGGLHLNTEKKVISKELQNFLNNAANGVIYFSLGTNVKMSDLPQDALSGILSVFEELQFCVVWKIDGNDHVVNSTKMFVHKWLPQQQILEHKHVKLFITQGGLQSLEEAVYNSVPIIGIPFFADQFKNVRNLVNKGAGIELDFTSITKEAFRDAILKITGNDSYKHSMEALSRIIRDRQISSLEEEVWWVEYVLRTKGAKIVNIDEFHLPFYQLLCLDIIAFFIVILTTIYYAALYLLQYLVYRIKRLRFKEKPKLE